MGRPERPQPSRAAVDDQHVQRRVELDVLEQHRIAQGLAEHLDRGFGRRRRRVAALAAVVRPDLPFEGHLPVPQPGQAAEGTASAAAQPVDLGDHGSGERADVDVLGRPLRQVLGVLHLDPAHEPVDGGAVRAASRANLAILEEILPGLLWSEALLTVAVTGVARDVVAEVLRAVAEAFHDKPETIEQNVTALREALQQFSRPRAGGGFTMALIDQAAATARRLIDFERGGTQGAQRASHGAAGGDTVRAAPLDHESGDYPVEGEPIVEALAGKGDEVANRIGRDIRVELNADLCTVFHFDSCHG